MSCPFCGQGALYKIKIKSLSSPAFLCDECETLWLNYEDIGFSIDKQRDLDEYTSPDERDEYVIEERVPWPDGSDKHLIEEYVKGASQEDEK